MDKERWNEIKTMIENAGIAHVAEVSYMERAMYRAIYQQSNSVIQDWVSDLPLRMQSVVIMGTRGPDTHRAPGIKKLTRWIRGLVFVPGNPNNVAEFMLATLPERITEKSETHRELEFTSQHYYSHLMHALQEIGYGHPNKETAEHGFHLYSDMCKIFHLNIELKDDHWKRLGPMEWPEGRQPRTGKEALELIAKHNKFSERDRTVLEKMEKGHPV